MAITKTLIGIPATPVVKNVAVPVLDWVDVQPLASSTSTKPGVVNFHTPYVYIGSESSETPLKITWDVNFDRSVNKVPVYRYNMRLETIEAVTCTDDTCGSDVTNSRVTVSITVTKENSQLSAADFLRVVGVAYSALFKTADNATGVPSTSLVSAVNFGLISDLY